MIALACLIAGLCLQAPQSERLRVTGPQPPVVVFPEASQIGLRIELDDAAQAQRLGRPRLPEVDGLQMSLSGPSTSQHSIFDGRRLIESVSVSWTVRIVPLRVGEFTIPSFDVPVGRGVERTPPLTLRVVRDVSGEEFGFLQVDVRPRRAYVHEPVRVRFELGVDRDLQIAEGQANNGERYLSIEIAAPWLGNLEGTVPIEPERVEPGRLINLVHSDGRTRSLLRAQRTGEVRRDGRPFDAFTLERSFLPSRPGKLSIPETAMGFSVFTGETRVVQDFVFARREPVVKTHYVSAPAVEVEVLPLPEEARPSPFYGAVGRFTISSRVDRERVRVGSSVKLTVSIRGEGNTEFLQVPELPRELDGLHLLGSTERRERGLVEATYDLTPLHADVRRTPEVRWNFFDTTPGVERYVEVVAPSVPITVEALPEGEGLKPLPGEEAKAVVPGVDDIFDMKELDAGEPAPALPPPRPEVAAGILLAPWIIALGLALFLRRHARVRADVAGRRERRAGKAFARALAAGKSPADALVAYLADRLAVSDAAIIAPDLAERLTARGVDPALAARVEAAVEAGVAARYGGAGGTDRDEAEHLVAELERVRLRAPRAAAPAVLLLCCLAGALDAQDHAARGTAAYRAGDYAAAAEAFAAAASAPDADRRLFYNLGNALYRQGELARALAAYERARLGMPRDPQLAANVALVRARLGLGSAEGEPFLQALAALRDSLTGRERIILAAVLHALAAGFLVLGWRRFALRVCGFVVLVPAALLAFELLWLAPRRPPRGVVVAERAEVTAEPRAGLEAVAKLRRGADVAVLGEGPTWLRVRVGGREGYVPADAVEVVR